MSGIPVVIATNGLGIPVRNVTGNAPVMTVAANGKGIPIVLSSRGTPFVVQGAGTPAPTFTVQPSITGTPTVGQPLSALTYNDGTVINGTISARSVLLAGVATPTTHVLVTGDIGSLVAYKNDATGAGGSASATSAGVAVVAAATAIVQNAVAIRMPGDDSTNETTLPVSTGSAIAWSMSLTNLSGAPITEVAPIFIGWVHSATGSTNVGNDVPTTAILSVDGTTIGTLTIGGTASFTITDGSTVQGDYVMLSQAIPVGGVVQASGTSTVANGLKVAVRGGFTALLSRTTGQARVNPVMAGCGDSIIALNGGTWLRSFEKDCPLIQAAIFGTTAATYGVTANFSKQLAVFQMAGCTDFVANWSINDVTNGHSAATIESDVGKIQTNVLAAGMRCHWATYMGPVSNVGFSSGNVATMTANNKMRVPVADASIFVAGAVMSLTEAAPTSTPVAFTESYAIVATIDTVGNTVTFTVPDKSGSGRTSGQVGTGLIGMTQPGTQHWHGAGKPTSGIAGTNTVRTTVNNWIRSSAGMTSVFDLASKVEYPLDSGNWGAEQQLSGLFFSRTVTVTSVTSTTTFMVDGGPYGDGTFIDGLWLTGANAGVKSTGATSGTIAQNEGNNFQVQTALGTSPSIGDTMYAYFYGAKGVNEADGLHLLPPLEGLSGGFGMVVKAARAWLQPKLTGPVAIPDSGNGGTALAWDSFKRLTGGFYPMVLTTQISDSGHLWYRAPNFPFVVNRPTFTNGRMRVSTGGYSGYLNAVPPTMNAATDANITLLSVVTNEFVGILLHTASNLSSKYQARYDRANTRWGLLINGTQIGSFFTDSWTAVSRKRRVWVERRGTTISMYVDINDGNGLVLRASGTDNTITTPGASGFSLPQNGSSTTGAQFDNIRMVGL